MTRPQQPGSQEQQTGLLPAFKHSFPGERPRMLFVHAHPDDESITTGATMAGYAAAGADVVLLTCTRGELGEVIPPELAHLQVGNPQCRDAGEALARVRGAELTEAAAALGVAERYFLGEGSAYDPSLGPAHYRDSGMVWADSGRAQAGESLDPAAFVAAELKETGRHIAHLIRTLRPHVVITYDADGGYGHPDHVRAHEATHAGLRMAAASPGAQAQQPWSVPWVYSVQGRAEGSIRAGERPRIRISGDLQRKRAAMTAHATQIVVAGGQFALSNGVWHPLDAEEFFLREDGGEFPPSEPGSGEPVVGRGAVGGSEVSRSAGGGPSAAAPNTAMPRSVSGFLGAVIAALIAAVFGTALHGQILYAPSWALPWGAVAALVLLASVAVTVGVWTRNVWMCIVTGLLTYVLVALLATSSSQLITTGAASPPMPAVAVAGMMWVIGIGVATVTAAVICGFVLRGTPEPAARRSS